MSNACSIKLESRHWAAIGLSGLGAVILLTGRGMEYLAVIIPALSSLLVADKVIAEVRKNGNPSPSP